MAGHDAQDGLEDYDVTEPYPRRPFTLPADRDFTELDTTAGGPTAPLHNGVIPAPDADLLAGLTRKVTDGVDRDRFPDGTTLRWRSADRYSYAALKAGGRWWITGGGSFYGGNVFTYARLIDILRREDVSAIEAATEWTVVAP